MNMVFYPEEKFYIRSEKEHQRFIKFTENIKFAITKTKAYCITEPTEREIRGFFCTELRRQLRYNGFPNEEIYLFTQPNTYAISTHNKDFKEQYFTKFIEVIYSPVQFIFFFDDDSHTVSKRLKYKEVFYECLKYTNINYKADWDKEEETIYSVQTENKKSIYEIGILVNNLKSQYK